MEDAHCERERHYFGTYRALLVRYTLVHTSLEHSERILRYAAVRAEAYRSNSLCYIYWRTGGGAGGALYLKHAPPKKLVSSNNTKFCQRARINIDIN